MNFVKNIWNGIHSKVGAYVFYALCATAFAFLSSAKFAHEWIAEIYPLGSKFVPAALAVIAAFTLLNFAYLLMLMFTKKKSLALDVIHTVVAVFSFAFFAYTAVILFGIDSGITADNFVRGFASLPASLPVLAIIALLPLAGLFADTPNKAAKALVSSVLVTALTVIPLQLGKKAAEPSDKVALPAITLKSENQLKGASVVGEMLKKDEVPDAANLLTDDENCWTPQSPKRKPAEGCPDSSNSFAEIQLPEKRTFNTALIEEVGNQVQYFRLQAMLDGKWVTVYQSEKIQSMRLCSFDAVTTDRIRLSVDKFRSDDVPAEIKSLKLYNEPARGAEDFEVATYQRLDGDVPTEILAKGEDYVKNYARYYDVYSTVIVFAAVHWDENGNMNFGELGEEGFARELAALKEIIAQRSNKEHEVKIIVTALADGTWDNDVNGYMAKHWESIADKIAAFAAKYDIDGVDIDWEYPATEEDWLNFDKFIARLDEKMKEGGKEKILSSALSAWALGMSEETLARFDQIQFMAYDGNDIDGYQSSLQQAQEGLQAFADKGVDISKINIGIAAYGRPVNSAPYWAVWRNLEEANYWDNKYYNVHDGNEVYDGTFCSPALAGDKTAYALMSGAGGVMVFRTACDKTMDDPNSVACGIENALKRYVVNW